MRFKNRNGDSFEIQILGYEFPGNNQDEWDSNWLQIKIFAVSQQVEWTASDPCLLTWEAEKLEKWLRTAYAQEERAVLEFTEPYIAFALVSGPRGKAIRVYLRAWLLPTRAPEPGKHMDAITMDFPLSELDLDQAVHSLKGQLAQFPRRVGLSV
jgi:hypothetical protein